MNNENLTKPSSHGPRARRTAAVVAAAALSLPLTPPTATAAPAVRVQAPNASVAPPKAAVSAAAIGKLAPTGCTGTAGAVSCDLYAMAGTTSVLGQSLPIWGFSATDAAGTATAPGPLLVVTKGDVVTVTLHNQLAQNVSLAFPGQPASAFTSGLSVADQTTGATSGGTATYTFRADRAGTFLYEAGHTPDGARQVAMGLAGALVVLDPAGTANGQAYDDEAVVVLSEIDPALNAHPDTFDMRGFRPRYRLINGKPFPSTDPIPTDQGHTVLLRYVNAGTVTHPMSLLGADQLLVAQDGHPMAQPEREVVAPLESGATADTLVTMPSGPETKVTLFEAGGHLDNDGRTEADPAQVAMGGMMTFLDTNAPPPTDDAVGPVPAHVNVNPSPSDGKSDVTVTADFSDAKTGGGTVTNAEIVVDGGVRQAVGTGLPMTGSFGSTDVTGATGTIPAVPAAGTSCTDPAVPVALECLDAGKHTVYVRGLDSAGNWGVVGSAVLNLPKTGPTTRGGSLSPAPANGTKPVAVSATGDDTAADGTVDKAEYFVDTVGADGTGASMTLNRSAAVVAEDGTIPVAPPAPETCATFPAALSCLAEGEHHVLVHTHDTLGLWGPVLDLSLVVDRTGPKAEPVEVAPSATNGVTSSVSNPGYLVVSGVVTDRDAGSALQSKVAGAEGFLDPAGTPAAGSGFDLVASDGAFDSNTETVYGLIPMSQVRPLAEGTHHVLVHGLDEAGNWGQLAAADLVVDKTAPQLGTLTATPNPTGGAATITLSAPVTNDTTFATAEFWTGATDPGVGKGIRVTVSAVGSAATALVPMTGIPAGPVRFNLRVQDKAGNWSNAVSTTVTVQRPNAIFSDTFDSGTLGAWSQQTGAVSASAAAAAASSSYGLQATLPGGRTNAPAYVTDNTPSAETTYHASFALNPSTLTNGSSAALVVLEARTANGTAFQLQFRRSNGQPQLRTVMNRAGTTPVTGAWRGMTAGWHTVRLDWTGATAGSLQLSIDGTAGTTTGNTGGLQVEAARLGVVSGYANNSAGTAYFDSFVSTRNTLP